MDCYSIPGWELSCAGAVAASRQDTVLEVPEVPGPPPAEPAHTHPENPHFSIALTLSARAELPSEQALA